MYLHIWILSWWLFHLLFWNNNQSLLILYLTTKPFLYYFFSLFALFGKRLRSVGGGHILAILHNKLHWLNSRSFWPVFKLLVRNVLRTFLLWIDKLISSKGESGSFCMICNLHGSVAWPLACGLLWRRHYKRRGGTFSHVPHWSTNHIAKSDHILTGSIFLAYHTMIHVKWTEIYDRFFLLYFVCSDRRSVYLKLTSNCCVVDLVFNVWKITSRQVLGSELKTDFSVCFEQFSRDELEIILRAYRVISPETNVKLLPTREDFKTCACDVI